MNVIIADCEAVKPNKAMVVKGWCDGRYTNRDVGILNGVKDVNDVEGIKCPFRLNCPQSTYVRPLVQLEMPLTNNGATV